MDEGGLAATRPSIVEKESGGALTWNRDHLPLMVIIKINVSFMLVYVFLMYIRWRAFFFYEMQTIYMQKVTIWLN